MCAAAEIPFTVITPDVVRNSVQRARNSLEVAAKEIVWQIEMEGWRTLGYKSWPEMREAEYGGAAFMVPSNKRPEIVAQLKSLEVGKTARGKPKHLTDQEIADTVGVSRSQVQDDLNGNNKKSSSGQNVAECERLVAEVDKPVKREESNIDRLIRLARRMDDVISDYGSIASELTDKEREHALEFIGEASTALGEMRAESYGVADGPDASEWSRRVQDVSASVEMESLSDAEVQWLQGSAEFLYHYCRGEMVTREKCLTR